jgi:predicted ferric reductase
MFTKRAVPWRLAMSFVRYNKRWTFQAITFMSLCAYIFVTTLWESGLARACGAILKFPIIPSIPIPLLRVIYTSIRHSPFGKVLGLDRRLTDHRLFAYGAIVVALVHVGGHLYNQQSERGIPTWLNWMLYVYLTREGMTGMIMLSSLTIPLAGVFVARALSNCVKKYSYSAQVIRPHQLGALCFMIAYGYHTTDNRLVPWSAIIIMIYMLDLYFQNVDACFSTTIEQASRLKDTSFYTIVVKRPRFFHDSLPGQYCLLSFPAIDDRFERSHPFTIARITDEHIFFMIRKVGKWTSKICDLIDKGQACRSLPIVVAGPFGASIPEEVRIFVGSGTGITPILSRLGHTIDETLWVYTSQRDPSGTEPLNWLLSTLPQDTRDKIKVFARNMVGGARLSLPKIVEKHNNMAFYTCGGIASAVQSECLIQGTKCYSESH